LRRRRKVLQVRDVGPTVVQCLGPANLNAVIKFTDMVAGIGMGQMVQNALLSTYYNMVLAWAIFYTFATLINVTDLPWGSCSNDWNTLSQLKIYLRYMLSPVHLFVACRLSVRNAMRPAQISSAMFLLHLVP